MPDEPLPQETAAPTADEHDAPQGDLPPGDRTVWLHEKFGARLQVFAASRLQDASQESGDSH